MYFSRSMWALRQATRNVSVDRQGTMGFTEEVVYHYLCHSLFHCCHLTTKTHTHGVFCRLKNNNKKKSPVFLQRKCHFSHHKTHPEKEERASSVSYPTQASLYRWNAEQLDCFSWLAVLFGGFDIGGPTQHDTKKCSEWTGGRVHSQPGKRAWWECESVLSCSLCASLGGCCSRAIIVAESKLGCFHQQPQVWLWWVCFASLSFCAVLPQPGICFVAFAPNLALKGLVWEVLEERNITNAFAQKVWCGEGVWVPAGF